MKEEKRVDNQRLPIRRGEALLLVIAVLCYLYLQVYRPLGRLHCNDFKHLYIGAKILRQGHNPYDAERMFYESATLGFRSILPYVYLPFTGLALSPLTLFSFRAAALIWFFLNHVFLLASLYFMSALGGERGRIRRFSLWLFFLALFFPLTRNLTAGQLNAALLFCFALIWHLNERKNAPAVGAVSAFAILFKLSPGILFLYYFWKRQWKNLAWTAAFTALFLLLSIGLFGLDIHLKFVPVLRKMSYGHSTWEQFGNDFYRDPFNQSVNSLFHHLVTLNPYTKPWLQLSKGAANILTMAVSLILLAMTLVFCYPGKKDKLEGNRERDFALFIMLSLLIPSLCWDHYLVQALWPIMACAFLISKRGGKGICALFSVCLIVMAIPFPFNAGRFRTGAGILMMSLKLWAALTLFILLLVLRMENNSSGDDENGCARSD